MSTMIITSPTIIANVDMHNLDTYSRILVSNNVVGYSVVDLDTAKTWCIHIVIITLTHLVDAYRLRKKISMA